MRNGSLLAKSSGRYCRTPHTVLSTNVKAKPATLSNLQDRNQAIARITPFKTAK